MSDEKHDGPWRLGDGDGGRIRVVDANGDTVCSWPFSDSYCPTWRAKAALIAAAPDLLRVLRRAADHVENEHYERMCGDGQEPEDGDPICTCYDEVDGAPDGPPPGRCLPCQIRAAISSATP